MPFAAALIVIVTVPAFLPVTTPLELTVATLVSFELYVSVPPLLTVAPILTVLPTVTDLFEAVIVGAMALIVTVIVGLPAV